MAWLQCDGDCDRDCDCVVVAVAVVGEGPSGERVEGRTGIGGALGRETVSSVDRDNSMNRIVSIVELTFDESVVVPILEGMLSSLVDAGLLLESGWSELTPPTDPCL